MVTIDLSMMYAAISDTSPAGGLDDVAYINRRTGKIIFLLPTAQEADDEFGNGAGFEMARWRASLENRPSDWVEIPKYVSLPARQPGDKDDDAGMDEHIRDFLSENNIVAELC